MAQIEKSGENFCRAMKRKAEDLVRRHDWGGRSGMRKNDEKEAQEERRIKSARCYIKIRNKKCPLDLADGGHSSLLVF